jgi:hypothetical protein
VLTWLTRGGKPSEHGGVNLVNPQQTVEQETVKQQHGTAVPSQASKDDPQSRGFDVVDHNMDRPERTAAPPGEASLETPTQLKEELIKRGVGAGTAAMLVRDPGTRRLIPEKLRLFDWAKQHRPSLINRSDGGWLRMAITTNYPLPADFLSEVEWEQRRQLEAERRAEARAQALEEKAREMARHPSAVAEQQLRINDRLQDGRRRPRLVGEERAAFCRTQEAQHRAVAARWFAETPECAHLKPDWLTDLPDDEGVASETPRRAPERFSRGSTGPLWSVGQLDTSGPKTPLRSS